MPFLTDNAAREVALTRWALPECLHFPIAAVDEAAITTYVGEIEQVLTDGSPRRALLVRAKEPPKIDTQFPIWELPTSGILHERRQVWVHIGFTRYRRAYRKAFPDEAIRRQGSKPRAEPQDGGADGLFLCADHAQFARL
jgi:hypothetical protein